jgi:CDGSH-type Zn-finger protein
MAHRFGDKQVRGREPTIKPKDNGPLLVEGPVRLVDADGNEFNVESRNIALCRCGASDTKPFCDGSHKEIDFQAAERAESREFAKAS